MIKRSYKNTEENISLLGFGCMRLPRLYEDKQDIDYDKAQEMIDTAYAQGVNYFDTAYPYHEGMSETFVGHALKKFPRGSFYLADKMPTWLLKSREDAERIFNEQLEKCQTPYFDFYLCHAIGSSVDDFVKAYENTGALGYLREEKLKGRIRHLGFSFHGAPDVLEKLVDRHNWDFVQIQLNYLDWDMQNAKRQYDMLAKRSVPCIVMEPVRGGNLCKLCDESVRIFKSVHPDKSLASWAIRFAASLPNVLTVLSGMSDMEQVRDNIQTMTDFEPLSDEEHTAIERAVAAYLKTGTIPCTGCRYCMDCPSGVDIPKVFEIYNQCAASNHLPISLGDQEKYEENARLFKEAFEALPEINRADHCVNCKACMEHCPQKIDIPARMAEIMQLSSIL